VVPSLDPYPFPVVYPVLVVVHVHALLPVPAQLVHGPYPVPSDRLGRRAIHLCGHVT
jgi:hypothetical protein